jgi:hypothetical protein
VNRFELWKDWSKHCLNHPVYKFLVLVGLAHSPTFTAYNTIKEQMDKYPHYKISFKDEKPEKEKSDINWGWYVVYLLMVIINSVMCSLHGFTLFTWQYWVYFWILVLSFVSGASYRRKE